MLAFVLFHRGSYQNGFALLLIPALLAIVIVLIARYFFPHPEHLEITESIAPEKFPRAFWLYIAANACIGAGFADFALIAFHFQKTAAVATDLIPVYYAVAMAMGALGALVFGKLFDKIGIAVVLAVFFLSSFFPPLVFLGTGSVALLGMALWGIGMGAQGSLLNALISGVVHARKRSTAFGVFDTGFGIAWFLGSWLMGALYQRSIFAVIVFSVVIQLLALPIFLFTKKSERC